MLRPSPYDVGAFYALEKPSHSESRPPGDADLLRRYTRGGRAFERNHASGPRTEQGIAGERLTGSQAARP